MLPVPSVLLRPRHRRRPDRSDCLPWWRCRLQRGGGAAYREKPPPPVEATTIASKEVPVAVDPPSVFTPASNNARVLATVARGADSQSGHLGLPFGVCRHLDPIVVQAGDQAHDRVADPQGPGSFPDEGSGSTKGVLPLLRVSRHSRAEDMAGLFEVAPLLKS